MLDFSKSLKELADYHHFLEEQLEKTADPELIAQSVEELHVVLEEMRVINEEVVAIRQLAEAQRDRYQSWFDLAPTPYLVTTLSGSILEANQAAADLLNDYPARLKGKPIATFASLNQRLSLRQLMMQAERQPGTVQEQTLVLQLRRPQQKSYVYTQARVIAVRSSENPSCITLRWALQDISEQIEAERELRRSMQFSQSLQRLTNLMHQSQDAEQVLAALVEEVADVLGVGCDAGLYEERNGSTMRYACLPPQSKAEHYQADIDPIVPGQGQLLQRQAPQLYGPVEPAPMSKFRGEVALFVCSVGDGDSLLGDLWLFLPRGDYLGEPEIDYLRRVANQCAIAIHSVRLRQENQAQLAKLQELDRLKDQFLSTISHELRTPVTNIRLAVETLKRYPEADKQQRYLDILQSECDREIDLVNDLLDLQQLEAGTYIPFVDTVDLSSWLGQIADQWQQKCLQRQQSLGFECDGEGGAIACDPISLSRIVKEFLKNAYKYTAAGGEILLTADVSSAPHALALASATGTLSNAVLRLRVRNTGHIAAEHLPNLFNKFYRVPNCDPWAHGGTGLGLTLVNKLAEFMGGTVEVGSDDGWVTFTLLVPVSLTSPQP
ncbi:MAG: histidine kinase dimerization/phospho-acceptor domain-containing protein [Elainellaceae cyanobacterium]